MRGKHLIPLATIPLGLFLSVATASGVSGRYASLEMLTLTSERIAVVTVTSRGDTAIGADPRDIPYELAEPMLGTGPKRGVVRANAANAELAPLVGDRVLVLWWMRVRADLPNSETFRYVSAFNLTHPERGGWDPALTNDFGVIRSPDSILATVARRVAMIRAGHPFGDDRALSLVDFASGRGCIEAWMPEQSEAQQETGLMGINRLIYPADPEWLPALLNSSRDARPEVRAWAATAIGRDSVLAGSKQRVGNEERSLRQNGKPSRPVDSVLVLVDARRATLLMLPRRGVVPGKR